MQDERLFSVCPLLLPQDKDGLTYDGFIEINVGSNFNHIFTLVLGVFPHYIRCWIWARRVKKDLDLIFRDKHSDCQ